LGDLRATGPAAQGDLIERPQVGTLLLVHVGREVPFFQFLEDAELAVRFHQGFATAVNFLADRQLLSPQLREVRLEQQGIAVRVQERIDVDGTGRGLLLRLLSRDLQLVLHRLLLLLQHQLGAEGLGQLFPPAIALGGSQPQQGL
jgi:hypothetical protein